MFGTEGCQARLLTPIHERETEGGGRGALVPLSDLVIRVHPSQTRREAACQAQCMPLYVAQRYNEAALTAAQSTRHINDAVSVQMASCYGRLAGDPEMRVKF